MDPQWSLIWTHSNAISAKARKRDAFTDPLERAEWQGLGWTVPLVSRLLSGTRPAQRRVEKAEPVERFTTKLPPKAVCVS